MTSISLQTGLINSNMSYQYGVPASCQPRYASYSRLNGYSHDTVCFGKNAAATPSPEELVAMLKAFSEHPSSKGLLELANAFSRSKLAPGFAFFKGTIGAVLVPLHTQIPLLAHSALFWPVDGTNLVTSAAGIILWTWIYHRNQQHKVGKSELPESKLPEADLQVIEAAAASDAGQHPNPATS